MTKDDMLISRCTMMNVQHRINRLDATRKNNNISLRKRRAEEKFRGPCWRIYNAR